MIYGVEGVGKSTFGARAPKPIFISPEGGTDELRSADGSGVDQIPGVATWDDIRTAVKSVLNSKHDYQTLVLDSADWIEKTAHTKIIGTSGRSIITANGGYGAGYRESEAMHKALLDDISMVRENRNMAVIVTAHAHVRQVKDPEAIADYDGFEIKCHEFVSSLWREWVDALLFARFRTFIKQGENNEKVRALGDDTRVVYTVKRPAFQAKNRYGLPPEMDFTESFWTNFVTLAGKAPKDIQAMKVEMNALWEKLVDQSMKDRVQKAVDEAGDNQEKLLKIYNGLLTITRK